MDFYGALSPPRGIQSDLKPKQNCDRAANHSRMVYVRGRAVDKINKTTVLSNGFCTRATMRNKCVATIKLMTSLRVASSKILRVLPVETSTN